MNTTAKDTERARVAKRIRELLKKTTENGCSEGEAMAAAMKARELADKYHVDMNAADLEAESVTLGVADPHIRGFDIQPYMASAIAKFCDCKVWTGRTNVADEDEAPEYDHRIQFLGLESDVDFAFYLLVHLEDFAWAKADEWGVKTMATPEGQIQYYEKRFLNSAKKTFAYGCAVRIAERLTEEARKREVKKPTISDGRALIVVKNALVEAGFKELGIRLGRGRGGRVNLNGGQRAYADGRAAGDGAGFGRPIEGGGGTRLLK